MPEPDKRWKRAWGGAIATLHRARNLSPADLLVAVGIMGLLYGILSVASQWTAPHEAAVQIDLSPWALPRYTFFSLSRGLIAYVISLVFTLVYGYWAAKDDVAEPRPDPAAGHPAEHPRAGLHARLGAGAGAPFSRAATSAWSWPPS